MNRKKAEPPRPLFIEERLLALEERLGSLEERLFAPEATLDRLESNLENLEHREKGLLRSIWSMIEALEKRGIPHPTLDEESLGERAHREMVANERALSRRISRLEGLSPERICPCCRIQFQPSRANKIYCSLRCQNTGRQRNRRERLKSEALPAAGRTGEVGAAPD